MKRRKIRSRERAIALLRSRGRGGWLRHLHRIRIAVLHLRCYSWAVETMMGDVWEHDAHAEHVRTLPRGESDRIAEYMRAIARSN